MTTPGLHKVVRPNQTPDYTPQMPVPPAPSADPPENVVLLIGVNGRGKPLQESYDFYHSTYQDKKPREEIGGGRPFFNTVFPPVRFENGRLVAETPTP